MPHFVMGCNGVYPTATLDSGPDRSDPPWMTGQPLRKPPTGPLTYTLDAARPGNIPAMIDDTAYPLMRDDLVEALRAVGVDNLEFFEAVIVDPATGQEHRNYKAFNIIGAVAAADMSKSVRASSSDSTIIDADFDSLSIDATRAAPFRLFRLAESVNAIVVDEAVKKEVERRNIEGMIFYDPEDWAG
jgi:hypothetical protein